MLKLDKEIEKNKETHIKKEIFTITSYGKKRFINVNENINIIKKIEDICIKNNIKLIVMFNPIHTTAYIGNNEEEYRKIKQKLTDKLECDVYDFSKNNSFAKNNYYWYETSHFRIRVGEIILKVIFKDTFKEEVNIPKNFDYTKK